MEILEIIDSAVKIGLGGVIGWISSYTVSKLKYDKEKEKYILDKKLSLYENAIDELEIYFDKLARVSSYVGKIYKTNKKISENIINKDDLNVLIQRNSELVESWSVKRKAMTKLKLIGAKDVYKKISEIENIEKEIRSKIIFPSSDLPSIDEITYLRERKTKSIDKIREKISEYYNNLLS